MSSSKNSKSVKRVLIIEEDICCVCYKEVPEPVCCKVCADGRYCQGCFYTQVKNGLIVCGVCRTPFTELPKITFDDDDYLSKNDNALMVRLLKQRPVVDIGERFMSHFENYELFDYKCEIKRIWFDGRVSKYMRKGSVPFEYRVITFKIKASKRDLDFNLLLLKGQFDKYFRLSLRESRDKKSCSFKMEI